MKLENAVRQQIDIQQNDTELTEKEKKEKNVRSGKHGVMNFGDLFCGLSILRDVQHRWSA